jgi:hypothetical protein
VAIGIGTAGESGANEMGVFDSERAASHPYLKGLESLGLGHHGLALFCLPSCSRAIKWPASNGVIPIAANAIVVAGISVPFNLVAVELAGPAEVCVGDDGEKGAPAEWGEEASKRQLCRQRWHLQTREAEWSETLRS